MSESEKFETQGRAHAALKQAKSNAATLTIKLNEYASELRELASIVSDFIQEPTRKNVAGNPLAYHLKNRISVATSRKASEWIDELVTETEVARTLQEQIENF
jgi:hypothetical protein